MLGQGRALRLLDEAREVRHHQRTEPENQDSVFEASKLILTKTLLLKHYYSRQGISHIYKGKTSQTPRSKPLTGLNRAMVCLTAIELPIAGDHQGHDVFW